MYRQPAIPASLIIQTICTVVLSSEITFFGLVARNETPTQL